MKKIIVAITGASGVVLGKRLVEFLKSKERKKEYEVHLIISKSAKEIAGYEGVKLEGILGLADHLHDEQDLNANISSSSYKVDAMVIAPCSMKSLAAIACGFGDNLVARAAENMLKMNRTLVVVPRDTPLSLADLENMAKLKKAGAIIAPPIMAYYYMPKSIDEVTDFFVGKILDCLNIEHDLYKKWCGVK
jgi:4-hydroxy-3-polyprenylbenzoate decarboxylase